MNKFRQLVRSNYTATMLGIISLSVVGSMLVLGYQVIRTNEQIALLRNIAQEISKDQQKQHDHQDERHACFFNIFITYTNTTPRKRITQQDVDRCRVTPEEGVNVETQQVTSESQTTPSQDAPQTTPTPLTNVPETRTSSNTNQMQNASNAVVKGVNSLITGTSNAINKLLGGN